MFRGTSQRRCTRDGFAKVVIMEQTTTTGDNTEELSELLVERQALVMAAYTLESYVKLAKALELVFLQDAGCFVMILALHQRQSYTISKILNRVSKRLHLDFRGKVFVVSLSELEDFRIFRAQEYRQKMLHCVRLLCFVEPEDLEQECLTVARYVTFELQRSMGVWPCYIGDFEESLGAYCQFFGADKSVLLDSGSAGVHHHVVFAEDNARLCAHIVEQTAKRKSVLCTRDMRGAEGIAQAMHQTRGRVSMMFYPTAEDQETQTKRSGYYSSYFCQDMRASLACDFDTSAVVVLEPEPGVNYQRKARGLVGGELSLALVSQCATGLFAACSSVDKPDLRLPQSRAQFFALCYVVLSQLSAQEDVGVLSQKILQAPCFASHQARDIEELLDYWEREGYVEPNGRGYRQTPKLSSHLRALPSLCQTLELLGRHSYLCRDPNTLAIHFLAQDFVELPKSESYRFGGNGFERKLTQHQEKSAISAHSNLEERGSSFFENGIVFDRAQAQGVAKLLVDTTKDKGYHFSRSAKRKIFELREAFKGIACYLPCCIEYRDGFAQIWTFAGAQINTVLSLCLQEIAPQSQIRAGNFAILVKGPQIHRAFLEGVFGRMLAELGRENVRQSVLQAFVRGEAHAFFMPLLGEHGKHGIRKMIASASDYLEEYCEPALIYSEKFREIETIPTIVSPQIQLPQARADKERSYQFTGLRSRDVCYEAAYANQMLTKNPWYFINKAEDFKHCLNVLLRQRYITLDVETTLYKQSLCLIQIAIPNKTFIIDPLVVDARALAQVFENPNIVKVIHNASFEKSVMRSIGVEIYNVADTLTLSRRRYGMGAEGGHSLKSVCYREFGKIMDKTCQTSDWQKRPLSVAQLEYAALDAEILVFLYERFVA